MNLGIRVRQERERLGLSREELVQQMPATLRMDPNTLWHIESGRTKNPRADQLLALAHVLDVSVDYLVGLPEQKRPVVRRTTREAPHTPVLKRTRQRRQLGGWEGRAWMSPDFDETDEALIRAFEGEDEETP